MLRLPAICLLVLFLSLAINVQAETPTEETDAITVLQGITSNLQKNHDGTVRFVRFSKSIVTDEHVSQTATFKHLDYLAVVSPHVTDAGLAHLEQLTNLDTLYLSDSGITDKTLSRISKLPKLEHLYLDRTKITDEGLESLTKLTTLKTLSLNETAITSGGLARLLALETLELLSLQGLEERAASFRFLADFPNLKTVLLHETPVQPTDLEFLHQKRPQLVVLHDPESTKQLSVFQKFRAGQKLSAPEPLMIGDDAIDESQVAQPAISLRLTQRLSQTKEVPDFQKHVMPMLGRVGCNGRTCHGSFQGQGGFTLSMFGYDFQKDLEAMTGGEEPRVNLTSPDQSLIIEKPTHGDEHGGGQRFEKESWQHELLKQWIANGAKGIDEKPDRIVKFDVTPTEMTFAKPGETVQLMCIAIWADGTKEDVTPLTRFQSNDDAIVEVNEDGLMTSISAGGTYVVSFYDNAIFSTQVILPVSDQTGDRFPEIATPTPIDKLVVEKLSKLGIIPSELCTDEEFLRRVSLDITGTLPTPDEVRYFVNDASSDKRKHKIEDLLKSPPHADWWSMQLADLTGSNSQYLGTTDMNTPASIQWNQWLRRRIADNIGWDEIAAGIVLARSRKPGQKYEEYAAEQSRFLSRQDPTDYTAPDNPMHYYWFRSNNQLPTDRALSFGYVFMGVRLQCSQCHKHPFDQWSKQDFEQFTQFFTRVKAGIAPGAKIVQATLKTKLGVPIKLDTAALRRQMYLRVSAEGLPIPWNEIWIEKPGEKPQIAKLLGDQEIDLNQYDDPREPLMAWLLGEDNPYFAPAMVNRIWEHYFGVGIVSPPDDFNMANPPSNKALLGWLSKRFIEEGYDMKWLHRTIANSHAYQRSWRTNETNKTDERNFSHALIRRLPAEVTIDAIQQATANRGRLETWSSNTKGRKITQHPKSIQTRGIDYSLLVFGKPLRTTNCDCERQQSPTLLQSLYLRNDHEVNEWLQRKDGWLLETAHELNQSLTSETSNAVLFQPKSGTEPSIPEFEQLIRTAYLRTVSREPTEQELSRSREHLRLSENTVEGLRDLMWVLINTQEFLTNH